MGSAYRFRPGTLAARWRQNPDGFGPDLVLYYDRSPADGGLLSHALNGVDVHCGRTLLDEWEARGFDLSTLEFTIRRKSEGQDG